jgi:hypothetical protein
MLKTTSTIPIWQPTKLFAAGLAMRLAVLALLLALPVVTDAAGLKTDSATKAVLQASDELPASIWKRIIVARSADGREIGYFLVFKLHGTYFSYDVKNGSRRIWPVNASARALAYAITSLAAEGTFVSPESFAR